MAGTGVTPVNALENQATANDIANRASDDYRELQIAALEKLDPNLRSRHALLPPAGDLSSGASPFSLELGP